MTVGAGAGLETTVTRGGWKPSGAARDFCRKHYACAAHDCIDGYSCLDLWTRSVMGRNGRLPII